MTNYLSELWGIAMVLVPLALLISPKHLERLFAEVESDSKMFCWGIISLVIGLAMILAYNVWTNDWRVVVTIIGWLALLKGIMHLFFPEQAKKCIKKVEKASFLPYALIVAVLVGLVLTYFGFTA